MTLIDDIKTCLNAIAELSVDPVAQKCAGELLARIKQAERDGVRLVLFEQDWRDDFAESTWHVREEDWTPTHDTMAQVIRAYDGRSDD